MRSEVANIQIRSKSSMVKKRNARHTFKTKHTHKSLKA